ncbi:MAG: type II toxin-antitoxin system death-on-curing family toxin [Alphaproteobacteria bacterium]|nr:type II toxin-antitoxin system death-on-curing family toxin [Alphaproteobacteria bacterium]
MTGLPISTRNSLNDEYLTAIEVLAIHADQIERYGGAECMRDMGALEAALFRPQTGYYANLVEEAAALWESLAQNYPFIDGNKRTAFAVTYTFLVLNGARLTADAEATYVFISKMYKAQTFAYEQLVIWLRDNIE